MPNGVRLARVTDVGAVAALQWESWRDRDPSMLMLAEQTGLDIDAIGAMWRESLLATQSPFERLFVATDTQDAIVGIAVTGPGSDPDLTGSCAELLDLVVARPAEHQGHGSRLLAAAAETLERVGAEEIVAWRNDHDALGQAFLASAGFVVDGARREVAAESGATLEQIRMAVMARSAESPESHASL